MYNKLARGASCLALAVAVGCSDSPTEPEAFEEWPVDPAISAVALERSTMVAEPITVSQLVGRDGGTIELPQTGLTVVIPRNAVDSDITITVTALPGEMLAYEFGPHGTQFKRPLRLVQQLDMTTWPAVGRPGRMEGGYFETAGDMNHEDGEIRVQSFLPVIVDPSAETATMRVKHFSGYMLSTGRRNSAGNNLSDGEI